MSIVVVDYKSGGNLFSLLNSLENIDAKFSVSSDPKEISKASKIIFPGVGSFNAAMTKLHELDLTSVLKEKIDESCPFLGICVGMQVLFSEGEESSTPNQNTKGIGAIPGTVAKLAKKEGFKIPHMGWNQVKISSTQNPLFKGIEDNSDFYFVHSYACKINEANLIQKKFPKAEFSTTQHSEIFISSFWNGENLFSTQFHPEKSSLQGLQVLKNFKELSL
jgi:imidazole glycerol-phosphate synthase subunit HisH